MCDTIMFGKAVSSMKEAAPLQQQWAMLPLLQSNVQTSGLGSIMPMQNASPAAGTACELSRAKMPMHSLLCLAGVGPAGL